jgi:hypothetical protein
MATPDDGRAPQQPPDWALDQATDELDPDPDPDELSARAWELARAAEERVSERHDEYDDPDSGGEA